jgi:hypothetical protein
MVKFAFNAPERDKNKLLESFAKGERLSKPDVKTAQDELIKRKLTVSDVQQGKHLKRD